MDDTLTSLDGKAAIVTGAGSGIGLELVHGLLARGAEVVGIDLATDNIPDGVLRLNADISQADQVDAAVRAALAEGPVDTLFNNAGIGSTKNLIDCEPEECTRSFATDSGNSWPHSDFRTTSDSASWASSARSHGWSCRRS